MPQRTVDYQATDLATRVLLVLAAVFLGIIAAYAGINFPAKIVIGVLLGVIFGILILVRPVVGMIFLIAGIPVLNIFPATFLGPTILNPTNLILGWITVAVMLRRWIVLRIGIAHKSFPKPLLAYALMMLVSMIMNMLSGEIFVRGADNLLDVVGLMHTYLMGAYVFFLTMNVIEEDRQARAIYWGVLVTVTLTALWGLVEYRSDLGGMSADRIRVKGRVGQANEFGAYLVSYMPFLIGAIRLGSNTLFTRFGSAMGVIFCFFAMLFTQSRGAYLGLLASITFLGAVTNRWIILVMLIAVIASPLWLPTQVRDRVEGTLSDMDEAEDGEDKSIESRKTLWLAGLKLWGQRPFLGHGFLSFNSIVFKQDLYEKPKSSHSLFVQMLVETGAVGMGVFLFLMGYFWRMAWRLWRRASDPFLKLFGESYLACLIGLLVVNVFGVRFYNFNQIAYFWIMSALLVYFSVRQSGAREEDRVEGIS